MAYRKRSRSSRRSYAPKRRYSSSSSKRSRSGYSKRRSGGSGQTLRLVLQNPGMQTTPRPAFGSFMPSFMQSYFQNAGMAAPGQFPPGGAMESITLPGAPGTAQGGPGIPGARMVINRLPRDPRATYVPPGYKLVREDGLEEPGEGE
jgi:hypothetical protein